MDFYKKYSASIDQRTREHTSMQANAPFLSSFLPFFLPFFRRLINMMFALAKNEWSCSGVHYFPLALLLFVDGAVAFKNPSLIVP